MSVTIDHNQVRRTEAVERALELGVWIAILRQAEERLIDRIAALGSPETDSRNEERERLMVQRMLAVLRTGPEHGHEIADALTAAGINVPAEAEPRIRWPIEDAKRRLEEAEAELREVTVA